MKSLNNHLSVIFPLFVLLFSLQFSFLSNKVVKNYAQKLTNGYSIVVVAPKNISQAVIQSRVKSIRSIEEISSKKILDRLKGKISSKNISLLKIALPKFYSIKLKSFPDIKKIESIKSRLLKSGLVTKVETFSKTHDKIYGMFELLKNTAFIFSVFIVIVSVLLMFKQMKIWLLEHRDRMAIMTLFGAPFWMKSAVLYRLVIIDSLVSTFLVALTFIFAPKLEQINAFAKALDIEIPKYNIFYDSGILLAIALVFTIFIVSLVIRKMNRE